MLRKDRSALLPALACVFLGGCGPSANEPALPPPAAKPDVIITVDATQHTCGVALYTEAQGSAVPCDDVAAFVRDELRLPKAAIYDLQGGPGVDRAEMTKIDAILQGAGYRNAGQALNKK